MRLWPRNQGSKRLDRMPLPASTSTTALNADGASVKGTGHDRNTRSRHLIPTRSLGRTKTLLKVWWSKSRQGEAVKFAPSFGDTSKSYNTGSSYFPVMCSPKRERRSLGIYDFPKWKRQTVPRPISRSRR